MSEHKRLRWLLEQYIDLTGNQQYWDFFAPAAPKFHQYLSVCDAASVASIHDKISCTSRPYFSNLNPEFRSFGLFKPDESRLYRLTENLLSLNDHRLLQAFTNFYPAEQGFSRKTHPAVLILHQFELSPGFKGLPESGYQMDSIFFSGSP